MFRSVAACEVIGVVKDKLLTHEAYAAWPDRTQPGFSETINECKHEQKQS